MTKTGLVIEMRSGKSVQTVQIHMPAADGGVFERQHLISRHDVSAELGAKLSTSGVIFMHTGAHETDDNDHGHVWQ